MIKITFIHSADVLSVFCITQMDNGRKVFTVLKGDLIYVVLLSLGFGLKYELDVFLRFSPDSGVSADI